MPPHTKATMIRAVESRHKRSSLSSSSDSSSDSDCGEARSESRQLLRTWLIDIANRNVVPGLKWLDLDKTLLKIPWTHGSRHGFDADKDSCLFRRWAIHSRRYNENEDQEDPKKWKANFRCAMNSLPDVKEDAAQSKKKGPNAFKVYRFMEEKPRKSLQKFKHGRTNTKASKKEKLNQERTKKLQHNISEQSRRQATIGVRRVCVSKCVSPVKTSSPRSPVSPPVTIQSVQPAKSRHNTQLLNRSVSSNCSFIKSSPSPPPVTKLQLPVIPAFTFPPLEQQSSPARGSSPPAELMGTTGDHSYHNNGFQTEAKMETLSPTTSIPTFVENDCEDFGLLLTDHRIMTEHVTEDELATCAIGNELFEDEEGKFNPSQQIQSIVCHISQGSDGSSSPTLSSLNGSSAEDGVMEMDYQELVENVADSVQDENGCLTVIMKYEDL